MIATWNAVSPLDRVLDDVMGTMLGAATAAPSFEPSVDVHVTDGEIVFTCDVPGVKLADLDVTIEKRVLTIRGQRQYESAPQAKRMLGRAYGKFSRAYTLPDDLDEEKLDAHLADGVLTITIPKTPKATPRKIEIKNATQTGQLTE